MRSPALRDLGEATAWSVTAYTLLCDVLFFVSACHITSACMRSPALRDLGETTAGSGTAYTLLCDVLFFVSAFHITRFYPKTFRIKTSYEVDKRS